MQTTPPVGRVAQPPPLDMQRARRWLLWNLEQAEYRGTRRFHADGSPIMAKVPRYIDGTRRRGDLNNDGAQLVDYAQACAALPLWGFSGLGFAMGDGWQGIDLDHVTDKHPELAALVPALPGYVEFSPSGTGYHAVGFGAPFEPLASNASGIEAYARERYLTFTGWAVRSGPLAPLDGYVASTLAPLHAAARVASVRAPRAAAAPTGDRVLDELRDALRYLDADDRSTWIDTGQALYTLGDVGRDLWAEWSATSDRFPGGDDLDRWDSFRGDRTGYASVFNRAAAAGWKNPRKLDAAAIFAGSEFVLEQTPGKPLPSSSTPPLPYVNGTHHTPEAPPVPAVPLVPAQRLDGQTYRGEGGTARAASLENVIDAIGPDSGMRIAYDEFQDSIMISTAAGQWRVLTDNDYTILRSTLGRGGFKPVALEIIKSAVALVAHTQRVDSARDWVEGLTWDGVPRVDLALSMYLGAEDNPYTRAVAAYLFTALAGRALVHPLQADMAVILVGLQGARKTTAVSALAPTPRAFGTVNLSKDDENLARRLRGKLVVEWAEMRGLAGRDLEGIKDWITRQTEEWRQLYREFNTHFDRRCLVVGTANTTELLDDDTGERRWLPVRAGNCDIDALERDRAQLWAEGAVRFRAGGVAWQEAEALAKAEHGNFKVGDPWQDFVVDWLQALPVPRLGEIPSPFSNGSRPFALHELALEALQLRRGDISRVEERRLGKILRALGYEKQDTWLNKTNLKRWVRVPSPSIALPSPIEKDKG